MRPLSATFNATALLQQAMMPAAEMVDDIPWLDWLVENVPGVGAIDWIRFGELLRHELGWDDTYPAYPDFPEADS